MYWNIQLDNVLATALRLTLTWDVLKCAIEMLLSILLILININMRCIEITSSTVFEDGFAGLTLTWDVLKYTISNT